LDLHATKRCYTKKVITREIFLAMLEHRGTSSCKKQRPPIRKRTTT
jgi:hypothetical protein